MSIFSKKTQGIAGNQARPATGQRQANERPRSLCSLISLTTASLLASLLRLIFTSILHFPFSAIRNSSRLKHFVPQPIPCCRLIFHLRSIGRSSHIFKPIANHRDRRETQVISKAVTEIDSQFRTR